MVRRGEERLRKYCHKREVLKWIGLEDHSHRHSEGRGRTS